MYIFEILDILFLIKNLNNPVSNFSINDYVSFSTGATRSSSIKLRHNKCTTNKVRHFYFNRISCLWNSIPIIDLSLSFSTIKQRIKTYFWEHFTINSILMIPTNIIPSVHAVHVHLSIFL